MRCDEPQPYQSMNLFYLYLAGVALLPDVVQLFYSVMVLRSAYKLLFLLLFILLLLFLLILSGPRWGVEPVGTEALQQCGHSLGFGQLVDLEVLLVMRRVLSDQPLLLRGESWPLVFFVAPLAVLSVVFVVLVSMADNRFFCKMYGWL